MRRRHITIAILFLVCFSYFVKIGWPQTQSHTTTSPVVETDSASNTAGTKGSFYLSQKDKRGKWVEKYREPFTTTYQIKQFNFPQINHKITLQIVQKNIPFGDIEFVKMNACGKEVSPSYAHYIHNGQDVRFEIAYDDHNVIVMHEKPIEIQWNIDVACAAPVVVYLKANEYTSNPNIPLRFPYEPLATIPRYWFSNNANKVLIDGNISEVDGISQASYRSWWKPATGHPSDTVHFYLLDDETYIYIFADITIDNTEEYGEDWFQVDVHNAVGTATKHFRITDLDQTHGMCGFTTTSQAPYKHQTCEARIDKSDVAGQHIDFAIQYYGTASGNSSPDASVCTFESDPLIGYAPFACSGTATDMDGTITGVRYDLIYTATSETIYSDVACEAQDGTFDYSSEDFTCDITPPLMGGQYQIRLYPRDNYPSTGYNFDYFDVINPPTISEVSPVSGSTIAVASPTITFTLSEAGQCRASYLDKGYDDMADDIDCAGDGTRNISCVVPDWGDVGTKQLYVACSGSEGSDTSYSNTALTYTYALPSPTPTPTATSIVTPQPSPTLEPNIENRLRNGFNANGECIAQKPGGKPEIFRIDMTDSQATLFIAPPSKPYTTFYITYRELGKNTALFDNLLEQSVYAETPEYAVQFSHTDNGGVVVYTINGLKPHTRYEFTVKCSHLCAFASTGNTLGASTNRDGITIPKAYYAFNGGLDVSTEELNMLATTGIPIAVVIMVGSSLLIAAIVVEEIPKKRAKSMA